MNHMVEEHLHVEAQAVYEPLEQIERLYVARIPATPGVIVTDEGGIIATNQQGEIRLYGKVVDNVFTIEQVRRIALAGATVERSFEDPFGLFSIVGPLDQPFVDQSYSGQITDLRSELNYKELSLAGLDESREETEQDVYFPPVVRLRGEMTWEQLGEPRPDGVTLAVKLNFFDDPEANANRLRNRVANLDFENVLSLDFVWAGALREGGQAVPRAFAAAFVFATFPCTMSATPCAPGAILENVRKLPLRLINLSTAADEVSSQAIFDKQIAGLCEVWRNKALLAFLKPAGVLQGTIEQIETYRRFFPSSWLHFRDDVELNSVEQIDVCLVDEVFDTFGPLPGGGHTYDARQNSAVVFLRAEKAASDTYLMAHELGHVLGLGHSGLGAAGATANANNGTQILVGSPNSVMTPVIDSNQNSRTNCNIFISPLLNPLVTDLDPVEKDCLRPDFL